MESSLMADRVSGRAGHGRWTDLELLQAIASQRDQAAFEEFLERHTDVCYAVARQIVRSPDLAADVVQEAMLLVWRCAKDLRSGNARTWLLTIVANRANNVARKRRRMLRQHGARRDQEQARLAASAQGNARPGIGDQHSGLAQALDSLSLEERTLVALYYGANLSQAQIGRELGVSQHTVSDRLRLVLKTLKERLSSSALAALAVSLEAALERPFVSPEPAPAAVRSAIRSMLQQLPAQPGRAPLILVAAAVGLLVSGAVWVIPPGRPAAPRAAPNASPHQVEWRPSFLAETDPRIPEVSRPRLVRTWDFNSPDPAGIRVTGGRWRWHAQGGVAGSGCMEIEQTPFSADLDFPGEILPVRVTIHIRRISFSRLGNFGYRFCGAIWKDCHWMGQVWNAYQGFAVDGPGEEWITVTNLITSRSTETIVGGLRRQLAVGQPMPGKGLCFGAVGLRGWVDDLKIEELGPEELPEESPMVEAVLAIPPSERSALVYLPQFKSPTPEKRVWVGFSKWSRSEAAPAGAE